MTLAIDLLKALPNDQLAELVRRHADEELARVLVLGALEAPVASPRQLAPRVAKPRPAPKPKPKALPPPVAGDDGAERVYRAVVGSDDPVRPKELVAKLDLRPNVVQRALRRLVEAKRIFKAGRTNSARYAVTQAAADEAVG